MALCRDPILVKKMNAKYNWKDVSIPKGAILSEDELTNAIAEGKQIHVVIPHLLHLWKNVTVTHPFLLEEPPSASHLEFKGANLNGRIDYNANFVFTNYWHAYAYLNKFRAP